MGERAWKGQRAHRGRTVSEAEFRRKWFDYSLSLTEIAAQLDISVEAVRSRARARGLDGVRRRHAVTPDLEAEFSAMWDAGVGREAMASHFGILTQTVGKTVKRLGLPRRNVSRWSAISVAEFQQQQMAEAMALAAADEQRAALRLWQRAA